MERSRRGEREAESPAVPSSSRLTVRKKNRRRPTGRNGGVWSRATARRIVDGCNRALRRSLPVIAATGAVLVLGTGLFVGYRFVTTSDRFAIEHIVVNGTHQLTPDQVRAASPVSLGDNVFTADLGELTARLRRDEPWIASADARRVLPDTIVIDVREHQPAAVVALPGDAGDELYLADARGRVFKRAATDETANLPLVTGLPRAAYRLDPAGTARQIVAALDVLRAWRTHERPAISSIKFDTGGNLALIADHAAIELGLPGPELPARMRTFDAVWTELSTDDRARVRTIHLDARLDHVTVAFKDS